MSYKLLDCFRLKCAATFVQPRWVHRDVAPRARRRVPLEEGEVRLLLPWVLRLQEPEPELIQVREPRGTETFELLRSEFGQNSCKYYFMDLL